MKERMKEGEREGGIHTHTQTHTHTHTHMYIYAVATLRATDPGLGPGEYRALAGPVRQVEREEAREWVREREKEK